MDSVEGCRYGGQKDTWDKVGVIVAGVGSLAVPLFLLFGGYLLEESLKRRATDIQEQVAKVQAEVARQDAVYQSSDLLIRRASLVRELLPLLSAADPRDRVKAYHVALWALPEDAPTLLSNLYDHETDERVRQQVNPMFLKRGIIVAALPAASTPSASASAAMPASAASPASAPPAAPEYVEVVTTTRSGPKESGAGRSFSESYEVCSDPPHPQATILKHEFQLVGDRACNAWSTCTFAPKSNRPCYQFTLQGHDEIPAVLENAGKRRSEGVLRVVYRVPRT
jgi:hypothetical protein